jgi:hypothetical protein
VITPNFLGAFSSSLIQEMAASAIILELCLQAH